jgi:hypothetical protein
MILVDAYKTRIRYVSEIKTEGVTALKTAVIMLKAAWIMDGRSDKACIRVV